MDPISQEQVDQFIQRLQDPVALKQHNMERLVRALLSLYQAKDIVVEGEFPAVLEHAKYREITEHIDRLKQHLQNLDEEKKFLL